MATEDHILEVLLQFRDATELHFNAIDGRLDRIDGRLDAHDGRFERLEGRLDRFESNVMLRFDVVDRRLELLECDRRGRR